MPVTPICEKLHYCGLFWKEKLEFFLLLKYVGGPAYNLGHAA